MAPQTGKKRETLVYSVRSRNFGVFYCVFVFRMTDLGIGFLFTDEETRQKLLESLKREVSFCIFLGQVCLQSLPVMFKFFAAVFSLCYFPLNIHFSLFVFRFYFIQRCKNIELFCLWTAFDLKGKYIPFRSPLFSLDLAG